VVTGQRKNQIGLKRGGIEWSGGALNWRALSGQPLYEIVDTYHIFYK
jgi:hypothetical protein